MTLKAGIIGLGVGEKHIEGYEAHPECRVTTLCDFSEDRVRELRKIYPDKKCSLSDADLLNDRDVDILSIASHDDCHYEQIVSAIENDKHIFVEKPLCLLAEEAKHIRRLLQEKPQIKISSNLILRRSPRFIRLRDMVSAGRFGDVFGIEGDYYYGRGHKITDGWRGKIDNYHIILGGGIHIVDLMLWLTGRKVTHVAAFGNNIATAHSGYRYHDLITGVLYFDNGMVGKVSANGACVHPHYHAFRIFGTQATFINGMPDGKLFHSSDPAAEPELVREAYPGVEKGDYIYEFVDAVINNKECSVSQEDIFAALSICFALRQAANERKVIEVEYI